MALRVEPLDMGVTERQRFRLFQYPEYVRQAAEYVSGQTLAMLREEEDDEAAWGDRGGAVPLVVQAYCCNCTWCVCAAARGRQHTANGAWP